ncbi:MAG: threonine synthase [Ignavibacteriales bacterium]|nr:threonine synthase [Ignavibacteriales bacterium]
MNFISVNGKSTPVSFRHALFSGIANDGGLYVPENIPSFSPSFLSQLENLSLHEISVEVASLFIDEIPKAHLENIISKAFNFPIPLVHLEEKIFLLELFHGPTLAFKDVGARFMAETLSFFLQQEKKEITVIVATSGDTGSAVANGFYNVPNISVVVLYPSGKISPLQEKQITTLGNNIHAIEVEGTFDDCQKLVKQALADKELVTKRNLTTANSINLGRLIPQIMYYVWAFAQLRTIPKQVRNDNIIAVVPSGNFGNLTAGLYAKGMGLPIQKFIAATNSNDVVPEYFHTGKYSPRPSIQTYSNAMDVGNPSNLSRIQFLYGNDVQKMKTDIEAMSISDEETLNEIRETYKRTKYILDPHTAVGVCAFRKRSQKPEVRNQSIIVAATAHYAKFPEVVEKAIGEKIILPPILENALHKTKQSTFIPANYDELKALLLS